jgi:hypothetical protein
LSQIVPNPEVVAMSDVHHLGPASVYLMQLLLVGVGVPMIGWAAGWLIWAALQ